MSAMSNQNNPDNDVNGAGTFLKVPRPAGVLRFDSGDPVVILLLPEQNGIKK